MKVLIVDFHDSFTYNLCHYFESLDAEVKVVQDELLNVQDIDLFTHLVLSPGPGLPKEKKNLIAVIEYVGSKKPILGVCLGMQGIAQYAGAELVNLDHVKHGVCERIELIGESFLMKGLKKNINVGLYHSWAVKNLDRTGLNAIAVNAEGVVMAFESLNRKLFGVQFHPESIMTEDGKKMLHNFLHFV